MITNMKVKSVARNGIKLKTSVSLHWHGKDLWVGNHSPLIFTNADSNLANFLASLNGENDIVDLGRAYGFESQKIHLLLQALRQRGFLETKNCRYRLHLIGNGELLWQFIKVLPANLDISLEPKTLVEIQRKNVSEKIKLQSLRPRRNHDLSKDIFTVWICHTLAPDPVIWTSLNETGNYLFLHATAEELSCGPLVIPTASACVGCLDHSSLPRDIRNLNYLELCQSRSIPDIHELDWLWQIGRAAVLEYLDSKNSSFINVSTHLEIAKHRQVTRHWQLNQRCLCFEQRLKTCAA